MRDCPVCYRDGGPWPCRPSCWVHAVMATGFALAMLVDGTGTLLGWW